MMRLAYSTRGRRACRDPTVGARDRFGGICVGACDWACDGAGHGGRLTRGSGRRRGAGAAPAAVVVHGTRDEIGCPQSRGIEMAMTSYHGGMSWSAMPKSVKAAQ